MSHPAPGRYIIYSRVLSPSGKKLAITHKEGSLGAVVTELETPGAHHFWDVKDFRDKGQTIDLGGSPDAVQAAWVVKEDFISVRPVFNYVWIIRGTADEGYTITDGGETNNWHLKKPVEDHVIDMGPVPEDPEYLNKYWIFEELN